uniref:Uncharacterized protein n=1 Tax=Candidatus Kentrum sp. DK TaxID=2126562 RepID=A0A450SHG3_9GAMM|nr:MAG: hypothetical protein BECKDK2373C_GA0170839_101015 [Candidatus Kentron sp. DK]VFJ52642.1 MAG: hypothetical protein BECKDK2373B_GA0170837_103919 [Candidatus Kentron sp. DK]
MPCLRSMPPIRPMPRLHTRKNNSVNRFPRQEREFANDGRLGGKVIIDGIIHTVIGILASSGQKAARKDHGENNGGAAAISTRDHD